MSELNQKGGASWKGRRATRLMPSSREIKLLRPICQTCEDSYGGPRFMPHNWWNDCEHDPYVSYVDVPVTKPVYEDNEDGTKRVVGTETTVTTEARPNWVAIGHGTGHNHGKGPERARRNKGFIFPQQLRSPMFPEGIKQRCQFRDCYAEDLTEYNSGWFCREYEAKLVRISDDELNYIYPGQLTKKGETARRRQLDSIEVSKDAAPLEAYI